MLNQVCVVCVRISYHIYSMFVYVSIYLFSQIYGFIHFSRHFHLDRWALTENSEFILSRFIIQWPQTKQNICITSIFNAWLKHFQIKTIKKIKINLLIIIKSASILWLFMQFCNYRWYFLWDSSAYTNFKLYQKRKQIKKTKNLPPPIEKQSVGKNEQIYWNSSDSIEHSIL